MQIRVPLCAVLALGAFFVRGIKPQLEAPASIAAKRAFRTKSLSVGRRNWRSSIVSPRRPMPTSRRHAEERTRIRLEFHFGGCGRRVSTTRVAYDKSRSKRSTPTRPPARRFRYRSVR